MSGLAGHAEHTSYTESMVVDASGEVFTPPGMLLATWLIAKRAAIESFYDPMTVLANSLFGLVIPVIVVFGQMAPLAAHATSHAGQVALGDLLVTYLLIIGLLPAGASLGIAAGVFAGEKEHGNLTPLLASPASNLAIFLGKTLGAVLPALTYAVIAEAAYLIEALLVLGGDKLSLMPLSLALVMLALVPCVSVCGAAVASVISSRVRTYNVATTYASLAMVPISGLLVALAFTMPVWVPWTRWIAVLALAALDAGIVLLGSATWKREEVLARR